MESAMKKRYGWVMAIYLLGIFIGAIDTGILTPARVVVQNSLGVDEKAGIWMITAFTLAYACAMPILGKLADRIGRKPVYMFSIALFGTGSLVCGLANFAGSFPMLIIGRVVQALGGGGIMPLATAEFGTGFPEEKRGMALGLVGGVYGVANILGATLGSAILDMVGVNNWQWVFFINLPICLFVVVAGSFILPKGQKTAAQKIDFLGIFVLTSMVLSLLYSLNNLDFFDFGNTITALNVYPFLILFAVLIPVFVWVEKKAADPIFNIGYFKSRNITLTFFLAFVVGICLMGMVFVPQFAENALKSPAGSGGYYVTILGLFAGLGAPFSGRLVDKFGPKKILLLGFAVSIAGALFLALVATVTVSVFNVVLSLILTGTGLGFVMGTPLNYMMLENTKKEESNSALSALSLMRSIGTTIGPMIIIGFIAQAGIAAQDKIMDILPPVSSIEVSVDTVLTDTVRLDLTYVKDSLPKMDTLKATLEKRVDDMEAAYKKLKTATAQRKADFETVKSDKQFASMLKKMDFTEPETEDPDFAEIRDMLKKGGDMTAADIDEKLAFLDFENKNNMDFDMNGDSELPDDVVQKLQSSNVLTIVENTKYLTTRMFEEKTPDVITDIVGGIGEGENGLQSGIDGMTEAIGGIGDGLSGMQDGADGIADGITGVDTGIKGMNEGISGMNKAISGMGKGIKGINSGIAGIKKGREGISAGIAGMQKGLDGLDKQIAAKAKELADLQAAGQPPSVWGPVAGQLEGLKAARAAMKTKLTAAQAQVKSMDASIKKMQGQIASMQSAIRKIKNAKPKLQTLIADVQAERALMATLQTGMTGAAGDMRGLQALLKENTAKMTDAQGKLGTLKGEIAPAFDKAKISYLGEIDKSAKEIEDTFQKAVNSGFTDMYYFVAVIAAIAVAALLFYRRRRVTDS
jgi:EmrB/QacA subfamily drug resistance transporter